MQFIASITRNRSDIRKISRLWREGGDPRNPFRNVLITPLFTSPTALSHLREMRGTGEIEQLYFDSGGFYVQMGRITYEEMYYQLLQFYAENQWADWYVLPDYVPLSSDNSADVEYKVYTTAHRSCTFYREMPIALREKAMPVIQGHTDAQIAYCLERYAQLDVSYLGFGSFGTNGKKSSANLLTSHVLHLLQQIVPNLADRNIKLHAFGIGNPPIIHLLNQVGMYSFDSIGWMKTAGFGKVYMPFVRAYNITYKDLTARGLREYEFDAIREETGHRCPFCESFADLSKYRDLRVMHNLTVVLDTIDLLREWAFAQIAVLLQSYSPTYAKLQAQLSV